MSETTVRNYALEPARCDELTPMRVKFAREMAIHGDRARAAANSNLTKSKTRGALVAGANRQLALEVVQEEIEKQRKIVNSALDISEKRILAEVSCVAFGNICDIFDSKGGMKPISDLSEHTRRAIKSVKVKTGMAGDEVISIEMHPKLPALQQLIAIKGMADGAKDKGIRVKIELGSPRNKSNEE